MGVKLCAEILIVCLFGVAGFSGMAWAESNSNQNLSNLGLGNIPTLDERMAGIQAKKRAEEEHYKRLRQQREAENAIIRAQNQRLKNSIAEQNKEAGWEKYKYVNLKDAGKIQENWREAGWKLLSAEQDPFKPQYVAVGWRCSDNGGCDTFIACSGREKALYLQARSPLKYTVWQEKGEPKPIMKVAVDGAVIMAGEQANIGQVRNETVIHTILPFYNKSSALDFLDKLANAKRQIAVQDGFGVDSHLSTTRDFAAPAQQLKACVSSW